MNEQNSKGHILALLIAILAGIIIVILEGLFIGLVELETIISLTKKQEIGTIMYVLNLMIVGIGFGCALLCYRYLFLRKYSPDKKTMLLKREFYDIVAILNPLLVVDIPHSFCFHTVLNDIMDDWDKNPSLKPLRNRFLGFFEVLNVWFCCFQKTIENSIYCANSNNLDILINELRSMLTQIESKFMNDFNKISKNDWNSNFREEHLITLIKEYDRFIERFKNFSGDQSLSYLDSLWKEK